MEKLARLKKYEDPFIMLSDIQAEDKKLREWLFFSLETLKKDKRRRKNVDLVKYFKDYKETWLMACESRGIEFTIEGDTYKVK